MTTVDPVLALLEDVTETDDNSWKAKCPAHNDNSPSLSLRLTEDEKVLVHCFAGCATDDVMEAIGLTKKDLFPTSEPVEYVYTDENGEALFRVQRRANKKFSQSRWDAEAEAFVSGVQGVRKVPYELHDLLDGVAKGDRIHIVEGERDCDRLRLHGLVATTNAGGALKGEWSDWAPWFDGAHVCLVPDNDSPGSKHAEMVKNALFGHATEIRIVTLPVKVKGDVSDFLDEYDIEDFTKLVDSAAPVTETKLVDVRTPLGSSIHEKSDGFAPFYEKSVTAHGKEIHVAITDFVFEAVATITVEEPPRTVFVVKVGDDHEYQLPSEVFDNVGRFAHWCNSVNHGWDGAQKDLNGILTILRSANVPEWDGTTIVGLHGDCFVLPEQTIGGSGSLVYVEHEFGNEWKGATSLESVERSPSTLMWPEYLFDLARLHRRDVMTPILGWVAAAPLRSRCSQFPILAISGHSGWGKTTIVETVLKAFGFWMKEPPVLPGATPHAVVGRVTTNNALPVWFDEYRDSVRSDTMDMFENVLRHAWNGGSIPKGGTNRDNVMLVRSFPVRAPIIVTGEESFTETSHSERMIAIDLPKEGRDFEALDRVVNSEGLADLQGFGRAYLEWLLADVDEDVKQPPNVVFGRPQHCEAIPRWGYEMLSTFLGRYCYESAMDVLPTFNYSHARRVQIETAKAKPYDELIAAAMDSEDDRGPIVWVEDDYTTYVRLEALYAWNRKSQTNIKLPSKKSRDLRVYLEQEHGAVEDENYINSAGNRVRVWSFPDALELT